MPVSTAQWMLTLNLLAGAIATPVMGRLSDGPHKKKLLLVSLSIILAGSVIAALAPNFTVFLIGRTLQGLTYGIVAGDHLPCAPLRRGRQGPGLISSLSVTVATGIGIGYPLTGIIAGLTGFRWAFWFAALFVLSAIIVVVAGHPQRPRRACRRRFPSTSRARRCWPSGLAPCSWGSARAPLGLGLTADHRHPGSPCCCCPCGSGRNCAATHPLINLHVFKNGEVLLANLTAIGLGAALYIGLSMAASWPRPRHPPSTAWPCRCSGRAL